MASANAMAKNTHKKKKRVGLSIMEEERLKSRLRETFPSEPWIDSTIRRFEDVSPEGDPIVYRFHDAKAFPPPAETTPMVKCPECGRVVPPNSMEGGRCMDHQPARLHNAYGSSPSGNAIQMLHHMRARAEQNSVEILPESKSALRREIRNAAKITA